MKKMSYYIDVLCVGRIVAIPADCKFAALWASWVRVPPGAQKTLIQICKDLDFWFFGLAYLITIKNKNALC